MTIQNKLANKIKEKKGFSLLGILAGAIAFAILAFPMAKWIMQMGWNITENEKKLQKFSDRLEMQSIIQDYWQQMNSATYEDFETAVDNKGKKWTENIGNKYTVTIEFSNDGKYDNAVCKVDVPTAINDRHCRNVSLSIISKNDSSLVESLQTTRVSLANESEKLAELRNKLLELDSKFGQYYKKTESDSRYIKKNAKS